MKTISLLSTFLWVISSLYAQQLIQEETYQFQTLKKNCYLGDVSFSPEDRTTTLQYVQRTPSNTVFYSYRFDENLKFVEESQQEYSTVENLKASWEEVKHSFKWFANQYKGEEYTEERVAYLSGIRWEADCQKIPVYLCFRLGFRQILSQNKVN